ncbi:MULTISPECIES: hypothetical protein [Providencia]|uniref:Uncharacterized protein n=1 Tax=Providencia rettgeri TaxID=587 RepID=A0A9N8D2B0_PRORE|nr:hypothetical protein [Providencia rettgeri]CAB5644533.1 Uncharacterised protein [Providencia rettgeri]CAB5710111.1 Uncharacterised protein [Providencia rettgeri]CAC9185221.1 Uncharacterised protein [Providencia rettgeri]CAC9228039.1 Uncharacterised protein [Providencia rettgeri]
MSNQHLEVVISELPARVTQQSAQIEELQKQLNDMQAAMSCELDALSARIVTVENFNR